MSLVFLQTPRESAEDRRVFPESDAPDEDPLFGLLLHPSSCCQCTHPTQVQSQKYGVCRLYQPQNKTLGLKEKIELCLNIQRFVCLSLCVCVCVCVCITVRSWESTWSQRGRPVQGSWPWPPVWVNLSRDWRDTRPCSKNWRDTWRLARISDILYGDNRRLMLFSKPQININWLSLTNQLMVFSVGIVSSCSCFIVTLFWF